jgi:hypothetical protein
MESDLQSEFEAAEASFKAGWVLALQEMGWQPNVVDDVNDIVARMNAAWVEHELKIKQAAGLI